MQLCTKQRQQKRKSINKKNETVKHYAILFMVSKNVKDFHDFQNKR